MDNKRILKLPASVLILQASAERANNRPLLQEVHSNLFMHHKMSLAIIYCYFSTSFRKCLSCCSPHEMHSALNS